MSSTPLIVALTLELIADRPRRSRSQPWSTVPWGLVRGADGGPARRAPPWFTRCSPNGPPPWATEQLLL